MLLPDVFPFDLSDKDRGEFFGNLNKQIADMVFDQIRLAGFTPEDIVFGDTYFIFQSNPNSVIHFRIKEVWNHFKFGMWVDSDNLFDKPSQEAESKNDRVCRPVIQLFCQYDRTIDKFKPSYSTLVWTLDVDDFKCSFLEKPSDDVYDWNWVEMRDLLWWIKDHPFLACGGNSCPQHYHRNSLRRVVKYTLKDIKESCVESIYVNIYFRYALKKIEEFKSESCVKNVSFDGIEDGWVSNPRMVVHIVFEDDATDEDIDDCVSRHLRKTRDLGRFNKYTRALEFWFAQNGESILYEN